MNNEEKNKKARPWDIFNKNLKKVEEELSNKRLAICSSCPEYVRLTHQCKKCGCIMNLKTKLPHAECPIGKWGSVKIQYKKETE
jgi:hypothetical protein